jgi:hypothetical protein
MLKINRIAILGVLIFSQLMLVAQNNTNSPYTRYGFGELATPSFGAGRGMGGIGYGLRSSTQINPLNPASYTSMDSLTFLFDFGASAQLSWFDDGVNKQDNVNGNIEYLAMQFPLSRRIAMSAGLLPYSFVGYDFGAIKKIGDTSTEYQEQFVGRGGLSQIYAGLSVDIWKKRLAVGANASYLFGNINHDRMLTVIQTDANVINSFQKISVRDVKLDFGVQYTQPISKTEKITVGGTFSPANTLSNKVYKVDQVIKGNSLVSIEGDTTTNVPMGLPNAYGFGLTYVKANKLTVGADVLYEEWKSVDFPFVDEESHFDNRFRVGAGIEYTPDFMMKSYLKRIKYRGGIHYSNSYLNVQGTGYDEYGASIGFGLPLVGNRSLLNLSFEYVNVAPRNSAMIKEQYLKFTVNYTFNEMWFWKRKLD